jgi:MinD-like ATPase involved in chromosome partitioning or flagellar assembly
MPATQVNRVDRQIWLETAGYRYSTFISWPRSNAGSADAELMRKLRLALIDEAKQKLLPGAVFLDQDEIEVGEDWSQRISEALSQSLTMVALCEPAYYGSEYCGREWAGMELLAASRFDGEASGILPLMGATGYESPWPGLFQEDAVPRQIALLQGLNRSRVRSRRADVEQSDEFDDLVRQIVARIDRIATQAQEKGRPAVTVGGFRLPSESAFADFAQAGRRRGPMAVNGASVACGGLITTFYSYKGGVGRTMAVANVGRLAAAEARGVPTLLIDWDLDAPGLHEYFPEAGSATKGLVEYFLDAATRLETDPGFREGLQGSDGAAVLGAALPMEAYVVDSGAPDLYLMTAGAAEAMATNRYQTGLGELDWAALHRDHPCLFQAFRDCLKSRYGRVLIDSRTGISDVSGICTAVLPDQLVAVFALNAQNRRVARAVAAALEFRRQADAARPLTVYPLASRVDHADLAAMQRNLNVFREDFKDVFQNAYGLAACDLREYFGEVILLYVADFGYGARNAVDPEEPNYPGSLRRSYRTFYEWIREGRIPWQQTGGRGAGAATAAAWALGASG